MVLEMQLEAGYVTLNTRGAMAQIHMSTSSVEGRPGDRGVSSHHEFIQHLVTAHLLGSFVVCICKFNLSRHGNAILCAGLQGTWGTEGGQC